MELQLPFTKMSGAGNDFILIDNRDAIVTGDASTLARALCSRHFGVGADGLLLLERSSIADFAMRYFNADGSFGGMCGNGGRCIARFAYHHGIAGRTLRFEALDHTYAAEVIEPSVKLHMKAPKDLLANRLLHLISREVIASFVDTGSPHVVIESPVVEEVDVESIGREIRETVFPAGTNVNFVQPIGPNTLKLRTYERGVEAETLACGTGAVASAVVFSSLHHMKSPVTLRVRSGEDLIVYFERHDESFVNIQLEGSAHFLFSGKVLYDTTRQAVADSFVS